MQPNKLNIAKWIVALRSGEYQQAQSALKKNGGYCCLGVACDISKQGTWRGNAYHTKGPVDSAFLPSAVVSWLGLSDSIPQITAQADAVEANDIQGMSFTEIADSLEALYLAGKKARDVIEAASAESKAWRILAEEHDAGRSGEFLCCTLDLADDLSSAIRAIPADVRKAMRDRIHAALESVGPAYDDSELFAPDVRQARVLACLMFAEQAADGV